MPLTLRNAFASTSRSTRIVLTCLIGGLLLLAVGSFLWKQYSVAQLSKEKQKLEEENKLKTDQLNEANGRAHAFELSAREERMKADALKETIAAGEKNVRRLEARMDKAQENYEKAKDDLGDCGDTFDECIRRLCEELKTAGFKTANCN